MDEVIYCFASSYFKGSNIIQFKQLFSILLVVKFLLQDGFHIFDGFYL